MRWLHKVLGTICAPLFVLWLLSGTVMLFSSFPRLGDKDLPLQDTLAVTALPSKEALQAQLQPDETITALQLTTHCGETIWRVETSKGQLWRADNLLTPREETIPEAWYGDYAERFSDYPIVAVDTIRRIDTWTPYPRNKKHLPLYRYRYDDPEGTYLYLSSRTGEAIQLCTRSERVAASCGTIPHMFYYWWLRENRSVWLWVVSILATLAVVAAFSGLYLGIRLYIRMWRRTGRLRSPYKRHRTLHWHLVGGVIFGLSLTLFALSGMISLYDLPSWIVPQYESKEKARAARQEEPLVLEYEDTYDYRLLLDLGGVQEITWQSYGGHPYYTVLRNGAWESWDALGEAPRPFQISEADLRSKLAPILSDATSIDVELLDSYDNYYVSLTGQYELPIYRVQADDPEQSRLYVSPTTGETRYYSLNGRIKKWIYPFCHNLRIAFFAEYPTLRLLVMSLLIVGGLVVSVTGLMLGIRYLRRVMRRVRSHRRRSQSQAR